MATNDHHCVCEVVMVANNDCCVRVVATATDTHHCVYNVVMVVSP